ncbi:recombinase [Salipiger aestuarii]|nr:recombinase [Salipiger aestuarii]KAB2540579.1 recombinase [Salipiger aestuarii]
MNTLTDTCGVSATQTILYARVSTADQTAAHQRKHAEDEGFTIDRIVADEGVSGVSVPFAERPEARRLFDLLRRGDTLVVRWVDRLGRDYEDVTKTIRAFMEAGVVVKTVINRFTFDGATDKAIEKAVRDSLIAFMAATAQAQAEATKAAQRAGIDHQRTADAALTSDDPSRRYKGRAPSYDRATFNRIVSALDAPEGANVAALARECGVSRQAILRIKADPNAADAALSKWGR